MEDIGLVRASMDSVWDDCEARDGGYAGWLELNDWGSAVSRVDSV